MGTSAASTSKQNSEKFDLGVWGGGAIGLSAAAHFAKNGVRTILFDKNEVVVATIKSMSNREDYFQKWIGFGISSLFNNGSLTATDDMKVLTISNPDAHLVAVNTEKSGEPWYQNIEDVIREISTLNPELCIVESTLYPGMSTKLISDYPELALALAPRRDWFLGPDKSLRKLPRIVGGKTPAITEMAIRLLGKVSEKIIAAHTLEAVELAKCIENSFHHILSQYATQLTRAYPSIDVNEALKLASSHWRMGNTYFAGVGIGGPCLTVSTDLIVKHAKKNELSIASAALDYETPHREFVADYISKQASGPIGLLGICYRGDIKNTTLSPNLALACKLLENGADLSIHDPYFTKAELNAMFDAKSFNFPDGISEFKIIVLGAGHEIYKSFKQSSISRYFKRGQIVIDNEGTWEKHRMEFEEIGVTYRRLGDKNWAAPIVVRTL